MKIALIQPKFNPSLDIILEPLNIAYIASFLKNKGYNNIYFHSCLSKSKKVYQNINSCDVVGISVNTAVINNAYAIAKKIKKINPRAIIVFGGAYPTSLPEIMLQNKNVDFVMRGESEVSFYNFIKALDKGENIKSIKNLSYKVKNKIIHNPRESLIQNLDNLPYPDRDLFEQNKFSLKWQKITGKKSASVLASRGCPFKCINCSSSSVWTRRWRARSPENFIGEIKDIIKKYDVNEINFIDSVFSLDKKRILEFCKLIKKENLGITWTCQDHISTLDEEMLYTMKNSGCRGISVGTESGSPKILKELNKNLTVKQAEDFFKTAKKVGLDIVTSFMVGSWSEDKNTLNQTIKFFKKSVKPNAKATAISILIPFPGSKAYDMAKKRGFISDNFDWSKAVYTKAVVPSKKMSIKEINLAYSILFKEMFTLEIKHSSLKKLFLRGFYELMHTPLSEYDFLFYRIKRYVKFILKKNKKK